jgi:hypothetical protein
MPAPSKLASGSRCMYLAAKYSKAGVTVAPTSAAALGTISITVSATAYCEPPQRPLSDAPQVFPSYLRDLLP